MARRLPPLAPSSPLAAPRAAPVAHGEDIQQLITKAADPNNDDSRGRPAMTPLDVPMLARKRSKRMLAVLEIIARDDKKPAAARVTAAKALLDLAKMDSQMFKSLDDQTVMQLAERVIAKRDARLGKLVKQAAASDAPLADEDADSDLEDASVDDAELPQ